MRKPIKVKFEKAAGMIRTYMVTEFDDQYLPVGAVDMKPGDEALVSHHQAHQMLTDAPDCFSSKEEPDPEIVAGEIRAMDGRVAEDQEAAIKARSNIVDRVKVLEENQSNSQKEIMELRVMVDNLAERIGAAEEILSNKGGEKKSGGGKKKP